MALAECSCIALKTGAALTSAFACVAFAPCTAASSALACARPNSHTPPPINASHPSPLNISATNIANTASSIMSIKLCSGGLSVSAVMPWCIRYRPYPMPTYIAHVPSTGIVISGASSHTGVIAYTTSCSRRTGGCTEPSFCLTSKCSPKPMIKITAYQLNNCCTAPQAAATNTNAMPPTPNCTLWPSSADAPGISPSTPMPHSTITTRPPSTAHNTHHNA